MPGDSAATATWLRPFPSVDHMFDLDDALTMPVNVPAAARSTVEIELPAAEQAEVKDVVCSICKEGVGEGKRIPCGHVYHSACISTWLSRCNSCPLCRAKVLVSL